MTTEERPNLRPRLNKALRESDRLSADLEKMILSLNQAYVILRREPENFGEAQAIILDAYEVVKEAIEGKP